MENQLKKKQASDLSKKPSTDLNFLNTSQTSQLSQVSKSSYTSNLFSNQSKTASFENYINIMKSDICQLQDQINSNSYILNFMMIALPTTIKKKVKEIEDGKKEGIKTVIERLSNEASNMKKLQTVYKTSSKSELIPKLYLEILHYELLIKKINEFFLIMHVNYQGDENIKDTISNIFLMLQVVDKMKEKISYFEKIEKEKESEEEKNSDSKDKIDSNSNEKGYSGKVDEVMRKSITNMKSANYFDDNTNKTGGFKSYNITGVTGNNSNSNSGADNILGKIMDCKTGISLISVLEKEDNEEGNKILHCISELVNEETKKWVDLVNKNNSNAQIDTSSLTINTSNDTNNCYSILVTKIDNIRREVNEKLGIMNSSINNNTTQKENKTDIKVLELQYEGNKLKDKITDLEREIKSKIKDIDSINSVNIELTNKNKLLKDEVDKIKKEIEDEKNKINDNSQLYKEDKEDKEDNETDKVKTLTSLLNECNNKLFKIASENKATYEKLFEELKESQKETNFHLLKLQSLEEEKELLKKEINLLKSRNWKEKDAYEELLIEQFDTMRNSFLTKLDLLNADLNNSKMGFRKQIFYLEEDLKQEKHIKEIFLRQINDLQKAII